MSVTLCWLCQRGNLKSRGRSKVIQTENLLHLASFEIVKSYCLSSHGEYSCVSHFPVQITATCFSTLSKESDSSSLDHEVGSKTQSLNRTMDGSKDFVRMIWHVCLVNEVQNLEFTFRC